MIFNKVVVTGPHRSGTTIATEILAHEWGLKPVRESEIASPRFPGDDEPKLTRDMVKSFIDSSDGFVLQGATTFRWIDRLPFDLVVFMLRDTEAIKQSQIKYRGKCLDDPSEKLKTIQSMNLPRVLYLQYESLREHPLFCENRENWGPRQTNPS